MQMFTSTRDEHRTRQHCADCAATNKEVRAGLAAVHAPRDRDISDEQEERTQSSKPTTHKLCVVD